MYSEGGTGENRSDVTPLNFRVVLRFFAKICVFKKNLLSTYSPKKISFRPHCLYCICITVLQLVDEIADSGKLKKCVKCKISGKLESNKFFGGFYGGGEQLFLACKTNLTSNWSKLELLTLYFPVQ